MDHQLTSRAWQRGAVLLTLFFLLSLTLCAQRANASVEAKVYPVPGLFWNEKETKAIDQRFMKSRDRGQLSLRVKAALERAFAGRIGKLNKESADYTFAVSFHLTRMTTYKATKADGNVELLAPVTGSVYFTNVLTGEILFAVSGTNTARALLHAKELEGGGAVREADKLYDSALLALIDQLSKTANESFQPKVVETQVAGLQNGLILLSGGYKQGIQLGDKLEDEASGLIKVVYAGSDYSVAKEELVSGVKIGSVFHKFIVGKIDGRLRPRTTVVVDKLANSFSPEYVTALFSEQLGDKAPLTLVQVNGNFSELLNTVVQENDLTTGSTLKRKVPDLIIRLRVDDPIQFETKTNLAFKTVRGFEANAFAEVIDNTGRVLFTAAGHDLQQIEVTRGLDLAPEARLEIAIKNALVTLAQEMGKLAEGKFESVNVVRAEKDSAFVATQGKVFAQNQRGFVLRTAEFKIAGKSRKLLFPLYEATAEERTGNETRVDTKGLFLGTQQQPIAAGDIFESLQLGTAPKTAATFGLCSTSETLGTVTTPDFESIVSVALGKSMPGMYYIPDIRKAADAVIGPGQGFDAAVQWDMPTLATCLQPVQRVDITGEACAEHCQKQVTARYTIRVKNGDVIAARVAMESKFQTVGYDKSTGEQDVAKLVRSDLVDEAHKLLNQVAAKLVLTPTN